MAHRLDIVGARALVTGASGGIGGAIARRLSAEGAEVILTGRREEVLKALGREIGAEVVVADLTDPGAPARLLAGAGRVDILVANAAQSRSGRLESVKVTDIDDAIAVNLRAPIALAHGLLPQLRERGRGHLVFIGSLQSRAATAGATVYCATKFGLRGFALALRAELARTEIGVSLVMPGFVSDAGLFADAGVRLPRGVGTRRTDQVADAVVRAIRINRGEFEVAPLSLRAGTTIAALAPELAARGVRLLGGERIALEFERSHSDEH